MKTDIFKVQVALATNMKGPKRALIYNRDRSIISEGPIDKPLLDALGNQVRVFMKGEYDPESQIFIFDKGFLSEQGW